jgi:glycosyltransferase involved in cell wall biosynthesis
MSSEHDSPALPDRPGRIALVTDGLPPGGSTTFLANFAGELARRKIPVSVLSFQKENALAAVFGASKIPVFRQDERRLIFEDRLLAVLGELRAFQPEIVLANLGALSFEVLRYLPPGVFRAGICHTDHFRERNMMEPHAAHMDLLAAVSAKIFLDLKADPKFKGVSLKHLPLGVPVPPEANGARNDPARPLRILCLGRLEREQKRAHLFPRILEQLKSSGIPFHWTIAGSGPERDALERAMQSLPDQTVSFAGQVSYEQVPEVLRAHDIFLLVSDYEGLPLGLLEAMAHGLVPVVSDLPSGIPEVVDAGNGMLVPVDEVAGYARAIIHLHGHRGELATKSAAARDRVKTEFSVAAMTNRWLAAFPPTKAHIEPWPNRWRIQAPLTDGNSFYFSPPMRVLRRLAAKLR